MHEHHEVDIAACQDYVWAVLTDVARWPDWAPALRAVVPFDGGPLVRGGGVRVCARNSPAREWHVAEVRPHRGFTWTGGGVGSVSRLDVAITPRPGGTLVGFTLDRSGWMTAVVGRMTDAAATAQVVDLAGALRRRCETGQRSPGRAAPASPATGREPLH